MPTASARRYLVTDPNNVAHTDENPVQSTGHLRPFQGGDLVPIVRMSAVRTFGAAHVLREVLSGSFVLLCDALTPADADEGGPSLAWLPSRRDAGAQALADVEAYAAAHDIRPILWPTARGHISDLPGILSFLRGREAAGARWRFILDLCALLTPDILRDAEEHMRINAETLSLRPELFGAVVGVPRVVDGERVEALPPAPGESGERARFVTGLLARTLPADTPLLARPGAEQLLDVVGGGEHGA